MQSPIQSLLDALRASVFDGPGVTEPAARRAAAAHAAAPHPKGGFFVGSAEVELDAAIPAAAHRYVDKVAHAAARVTDADFEAAHSVLGDDAVFELTVATAVGAGLARYERALALLSEEAP